MIQILPLFPLTVAVLPGQRIPLHIFEDRYKKLMKVCMTKGLADPSKEFGINYVSEDGLAAIGCSLSVVRVIKRFKDGRLDIIAEGKRRFRLCELVEGKSYQQGKIEFLTEVENQHQDPKTMQSFFELHREMCVVAGVKSELNLLQVPASYQSASAIGIKDLHKQTLLELASEQDRVVWLSDLYRRVLSQVKSGKNSIFTGVLSARSGNHHAGFERVH